MKQLIHPGDAHSTPAGTYSVNVIYLSYGAGQHLYRVTVTIPGFSPQPAFDRDHDRSFGHSDHELAQKIAEHYADGLVELLNVEAEGISDERIEQVVAELNADADGYLTAEVEVHNALVAAKDEIVADADPNWKANLRKQVVAQANQGLARFAQSRTTRPVKLTPAQTAIVTHAAGNGGRIVRGGQVGQATSRQIIALDACGLVETVYGWTGNKRAITGARLTDNGFKHAGVELGSAA